MERDETAETFETALSDQETQEAVVIVLAAGCTAPEIRAWFSFQAGIRVN